MAFLPAIVSAVGSGGLAAAGAGLSALGSIAQGRAAAQAGKYEAQRQRAEADAEAARLRRVSGRKMGQMRASISKSGVTREGSPMMALAESAELSELDALLTGWKGESAARLSEARGKAARTASYFSAGSSLLTGMSKIA